mmetsp:Transcript_72467/g.172749  ORF Transcript_72467/g.172749 Transcript_72467/m.172749 type:complete len:342 (-) Transcript_72467:181-1206(-)
MGAEAVPQGFSPRPAAEQGLHHHLYVYGEYQDPLFQKYRAAAEHLAAERRDFKATIQAFYQSQYEQHLRSVINDYGGAFTQAKSSSALVFAETSDEKVLYFLDEKRFFDWAFKRFKYEDNTRMVFYKHIGTKALEAMKASTGRSYCAIGITVGSEPQEVVQFELFDEECPELCRNFLNILRHEKFDGHPVHRVKAGAWLQAGDLVDGSGLNSEAAGGGLLRHESFKIPHDRSGLLGMSSHGQDTIGSQFYITLKDLPFLNGKSVIFGRVISGMQSCLKVGRVAARNERPVEAVTVTNVLNMWTPGQLQAAVANKQDAVSQYQPPAKKASDSAPEPEVAAEN